MLYSIALVIIFLASLAGLAGPAIVTLAALIATPILLMVLLMIMIVNFIWGMLGGKMSARQVFSIFSYFFGVIVVTTPIAVLLIQAVFWYVTTDSPRLYQKIWAWPSIHEPISAYEWTLGAIPFLTIFVVMMMLSRWLSPARKAFHKMQSLSRGRNFLAQGLFGVMWPLACISVFLVSAKLVRIALAS